jgi:hypothetical protein
MPKVAAGRRISSTTQVRGEMVKAREWYIVLKEEVTDSRVQGIVETVRG